MASLGFMLDCCEIDAYGDASYAAFNAERAARRAPPMARDEWERQQHAEYLAELASEDVVPLDEYKAAAVRAVWPDSAADAAEAAPAMDAQADGVSPMGDHLAGGDSVGSPAFALLVERYAALDLSMIPIDLGSKSPKGFGWPDKGIKDAAAALRIFGNGARNLGVVLGQRSGGIIDIDLDCPEALALTDHLPTTSAIFGRDSTPRSHLIYRVEGFAPTKKFVDPLMPKGSGEKSMIIEVRGDGNVQTVFPPSLHPTGERISWAEFGDIAWVTYDELVAAATTIAVAVMVSRYGDKGRHHPDVKKWLGETIEPLDPRPPPGAQRNTGKQIHAGKREIAAANGLLKFLADKLAATTEGGRNSALNDAALALGHEVAASRISRAEVYDALYDACRRNGLLAQDGRRAFDATFLSGFEAGLLEPAGPLKDRQTDGGQSIGATEKLIDGLRRKAEEVRAKAPPSHNPGTGEVVDEDPNADDAGARHDGVDGSEDAEGPEKLSAAWWRRLQLPPRDYLLGDVICSTSRWHLAGETGTGKTLFSLDMAAAIATGSDFLGWEGRRPSRVMYLDGEMPAETFQERMNVVIDRYGEGMSLFGYNRDVLGQDDMPPLNSDKGMVWLWNEIQKIKPDAIFFDSVMCLLEGNMSEEDSWNPIKPYIRFLTSQRIAQVWIDHTGHDATRAYGTKTKQWEMDTVAMLSKLKGEEFDDSAAAMQFEFAKKRLCTPSNYKQFQPKIITGGENGLVHKDGQGSSKKVSQLDVIKRQFVVVYDRLAFDVEYSAGHAGENVKKVAVADVRERLKSTGYLDTNDKGQITSSDRQTFKKAKTSLLINGGFTEKDGMVWRFKDA